MTRKPKVSVAEARRIVQAHQDAERQQQAEHNRAFIGHYFKYRNSYGGGDPDWWLYATVTAVDEYGTMTGPSFQITAHGIVEIEAGQRITGIESSNRGWTEISAEEFWAEAHNVTAHVTALLRRPTSEAA